MICKVLLLVSFPVPALQAAASNKILVENCPSWWDLLSEPSKYYEILCFLCHRFRQPSWPCLLSISHPACSPSYSPHHQAQNWAASD